MKKLIFCTIISALILGTQKFCIYGGGTKAIDNTKELSSLSQQFQKVTKNNDDMVYKMTNFSKSINQINKQIDENFQLIDKLEQQNKRK